MAATGSCARMDHTKFWVSFSAGWAYTIQGCVLALIDALKRDVSGQVDTPYHDWAWLCMLPFALKFIAAPIMDVLRCRPTSSVRPSIVCYLLLTALLLALKATVFSHYEVPIMLAISAVTAVADVGVDSIVLDVCPRWRSWLQVAGIILGRTLGMGLASAHTDALAQHQRQAGEPGWGVDWALFTMLTMLAMSLFGFAWCVGDPPRPHSAGNFSGQAWDVLQWSWRHPFTWVKAWARAYTHVVVDVLQWCWWHPVMWVWLLHQLVPPAGYFHMDVLEHGCPTPSGQELLASFVVGLVVVTALAWCMHGWIKGFFGFYFVLVPLCVYLLHVVKPDPSESTEAYCGTWFQLAKAVIFFVFELGESTLYGNVANQNSRVATSLLALQASTFNVAEFAWPKLAVVAVDDMKVPYSAVAIAGTALCCLFVGGELIWLQVAGTYRDFFQPRRSKEDHKD